MLQIWPKFCKIGHKIRYLTQNIVNLAKMVANSVKNVVILTKIVANLAKNIANILKMLQTQSNFVTMA